MSNRHAPADTSASSSQEVEVHVSPLTHVAAPLIAFGATMIARKALDFGYRRATGHDAPNATDPQVRLSRALAWTAVTAVTAAVVEVAVYRAVTRRGMTSL